MGAAIRVFDGAEAIHVPRSRFAPVKTTDDLLAVRSDAYVLTDDYRVVSNPSRPFGPVVVALDPRYYKLIDDLEARFPYGPPSLAECRRLTVEGDCRFGRDVVLCGDVTLSAPDGVSLEIPDNLVIEDSTGTPTGTAA
jgi:UTP--glucose-1-phosphate uridylyltransferase